MRSGKLVLAGLLVAAVAVTVPTAAGGSPAPRQPAAQPGRSAQQAAAPAEFAHPGVLVNKAQLDFVRGKVRAGEEPWKTAYDRMAASEYASLSRTPKPREIVECGSGSNPDHGCTEEREDAIAAYTQALAWYVTRDERHAKKAIELMDAWSATIKDHTNSNAPLQSGWAGGVWPRAAEIVKYTYPGGWSGSGRFATMLRDVYLPEVIEGAPGKNGNWELIMMAAAQGIAVHLEDRASYDKAMEIFDGRVPAYVYLKGDGGQPAYPPRSSIDTRTELVKYWHGQSSFAWDGLSQETCRDFGHTGWGIDALSHVAETSRIQGADRYPELKDRLRHALGFHTRIENGGDVPSTLCGGTVKKGFGATTEIAYNALHTRMGLDLTDTGTYTESRRPHGTDDHFIAWETLTHAENPS
ncbi:alginate lyase family protein [Streptomyces sp. LHD-70]|uniref:alginate lyase family protein n=1 Tax=Streptomyces sp. LHD-70 TaxID=3072140 RepID=UPI00280E8388|nr:alginate lyase family protein [Streptomyces sp. LHD-70]MDQ8703805.1 alginate lyase family protein [Streptomyces sp. LHD-70]